jgi:hypothetical protein
VWVYGPGSRAREANLARQPGPLHFRDQKSPRLGEEKSVVGRFVSPERPWGAAVVPGTIPRNKFQPRRSGSVFSLKSAVETQRSQRARRGDPSIPPRSRITCEVNVFQTINLPHLSAFVLFVPFVANPSAEFRFRRVGPTLVAGPVFAHESAGRRAVTPQHDGSEDGASWRCQLFFALSGMTKSIGIRTRT